MYYKMQSDESDLLLIDIKMHKEQILAHGSLERATRLVILRDHHLKLA